jgi:hypothetical protein
MAASGDDKKDKLFNGHVARIAVLESSGDAIERRRNKGKQVV